MTTREGGGRPRESQAWATGGGRPSEEDAGIVIGEGDVAKTDDKEVGDGRARGCSSEGV